MLEIKHLHKHYGDLHAVNDVSLKIESGRSLVLVGESGSGKSTLSRITAGILTADSGSILLDGRPLASGCRKRSFDDCVNIQYIFQDPYNALDPSSTARQVLQEAVRICKRHHRPCMTPEEALSRVDAALLPALDHAVGTLSGGQRQKVCIARALIPHPKVIIADESTSMLDRQSSLDIFTQLNRIKEETGISLLVILHDMDFSYPDWDRIAVLRNGCLVEEADFSDFYIHARHAYSRALIAAYDYFNRRNQA